MNNADLYSSSNLMQRKDSETILREVAAEMNWAQVKKFKRRMMFLPK